MSEAKSYSYGQYLDEIPFQTWKRVGRQFWADEQSSPYVDPLGQLQRRMDRYQSYQYEPSPDTIDLPLVRGALFDAKGTQMCEQGISVGQDGDGYMVNIHIIDPDWASKAYGNIAVLQELYDYRAEQLGVPFTITRGHSLERNSPRFSSLNKGDRPVVSFSYRIGSRANPKDIDFSDATVEAGVLKPVMQVNLDNPGEILEDARLALTPEARELKNILKAARQMGESEGTLHRLAHNANLVAAQWAQAQGVDLLYLNRGPKDPRSFLSIVPEGDAMVKGMLNAPVTAPYRNPAAYFNQRIITGILKDGRSPYTRQELSQIGEFIQTGDLSTLEGLTPGVAWEARAARGFLFKEGNIRVLADIFLSVPANFAELPIRRYFIHRLNMSRKNYDIMSGIEGLQIKEEAIKSDSRRKKPYSCLLYVVVNGIEHQCIGFGDDAATAQNSAAFSVLMSVLKGGSIFEDDLGTKMQKAYLRGPLYARVAIRTIDKLFEEK